MDEFEVSWILLCLTNALEAICRYLGGKGCDTAKKIKRTLREQDLITSNGEEKLIEKAYKYRSELIAHPPGRKETIGKIDLIAKDYLYLHEREGKLAEYIERLYRLLQGIILGLLRKDLR